MPATLTDRFTLEGDELELGQAEAIKNQGIALIDADVGPFQVDLVDLDRANSVTIAVLLAWHRRAVLTQKSIGFVNLSGELHNIIEFSGLSPVLLPSAKKNNSVEK